jgi:ATP/maltotriose-dependent transcriptional regulator MalT
MKQARPIETLTRREHAVLQLVQAGLSNRQIAAEFSLSENTIKFHLKNIFGKLGASRRTQAVSLAQALPATAGQPLERVGA